jgi:hypothetical protein
MTYRKLNTELEGEIKKATRLGSPSKNGLLRASKSGEEMGKGIPP